MDSPVNISVKWYIICSCGIITLNLRFNRNCDLFKPGLSHIFCWKIWCHVQPHRKLPLFCLRWFPKHILLEDSPSICYACFFLLRGWSLSKLPQGDRQPSGLQPITGPNNCTFNLESKPSQTRMYLDCGRKLDPNQASGEHVRSRQKGPSWDLNQGPSCCEACLQISLHIHNHF